MNYVYDEETDEILFEGTKEQCMNYIESNIDEASDSFYRVWIK